MERKRRQIGRWAPLPCPSLCSFLLLIPALPTSLAASPVLEQSSLYPPGSEQVWYQQQALLDIQQLNQRDRRSDKPEGQQINLPKPLEAEGETQKNLRRLRGPKLVVIFPRAHLASASLASERVRSALFEPGAMGSMGTMNIKRGSGLIKDKPTSISRIVLRRKAGQSGPRMRREILVDTEEGQRLVACGYPGCGKFFPSKPAAEQHRGSEGHAYDSAKALNTLMQRLAAVKQIVQKSYRLGFLRPSDQRSFAETSTSIVTSMPDVASVYRIQESIKGDRTVVFPVEDKVPDTIPVCVSEGEDSGTTGDDCPETFGDGDGNLMCSYSCYQPTNPSLPHLFEFIVPPSYGGVHFRFGLNLGEPGFLARNSGVFALLWSKEERNAKVEFRIGPCCCLEAVVHNSSGQVELVVRSSPQKYLSELQLVEFSFDERNGQVAIYNDDICTATKSLDLNFLRKLLRCSILSLGPSTRWVGSRRLEEIVTVSSIDNLVPKGVLASRIYRGARTPRKLWLRSAVVPASSSLQSNWSIGNLPPESPVKSKFSHFVLNSMDKVQWAVFDLGKCKLVQSVCMQLGNRGSNISLSNVRLKAVQKGKVDLSGEFEWKDVHVSEEPMEFRGFNLRIPVLSRSRYWRVVVDVTTADTRTQGGTLFVQFDGFSGQFDLEKSIEEALSRDLRRSPNRPSQFKPSGRGRHRMLFGLMRRLYLTGLRSQQNFVDPLDWIPIPRKHPWGHYSLNVNIRDFFPFMIESISTMNGEMILSPEGKGSFIWYCGGLQYVQGQLHNITYKGNYLRALYILTTKDGHSNRGRIKWKVIHKGEFEKTGGIDDELWGVYSSVRKPNVWFWDAKRINSSHHISITSLFKTDAFRSAEPKPIVPEIGLHEYLLPSNS
mmetsp:Transcript_11329/g.27871  ORF Transcript_11329/g.27871 Transcript_11329/m.27871 type:complete len:886 (+) Transcript_11329:400-3057(+)